MFAQKAQNPALRKICQTDAGKLFDVDGDPRDGFVETASEIISPRQHVIIHIRQRIEFDRALRFGNTVLESPGGLQNI